MTTGLVKVVGIGATGLVAATLADRRRDDVGLLDTLVGGAVVAGAANLANLLDLRPGRALKVTVLSALPLLVAGDGESGAAGRCGGRRCARGAAARPRGHARCSATPAPTPRVRSSAPPCSGRPAGPGALAALAVLAGLTLASERV